MAGVYGDINSRTDFFYILGEATTKVRQLVARQLMDNALSAIYRQLTAIEQWTLNDRTPTDDERKSLDVGLRATRELENTGDPALDELSAQLQMIHNYVDDWPSDDEAANATDDDYFESDD